MSLRSMSTAAFHEEWWLNAKFEVSRKAELHARLVPIRAMYSRASAHRQAELLADINAFITDAKG